MDVLRPLRAGLFFYEIFRLLALVILIFILPLESGLSAGRGFIGGNPANGAFPPYVVYLSANALFPLLALFVWLKPEEYHNYLPLYMAGKIIGVVSFYSWEIFSSRQFFGAENVVKSLILIGGGALLGLLDMLSVWGAWTLRNKFRKALESAPERGGI